MKGLAQWNVQLVLECVAYYEISYRSIAFECYEVPQIRPFSRPKN